MINLYSDYLNTCNKKILVFGSRGYLASRYRLWSEQRENKFTFISAAEIGENPKAVLKSLHEYDIVINTVANTDVNSTESSIINKQLEINKEWPELLTLWSKKLGFKLIHISTADIYCGKANTIALTTPYYCSKYYGDLAVLENPDSLVLRPRLLYDDSDNPKNLINKIKTYKSAYDLIQAVTSTDLIVAASLFLSDKSGIYDLSDDWINIRFLRKDLPINDSSSQQSICIYSDKLLNEGFEIPENTFEKYQNAR